MARVYAVEIADELDATAKRAASEVGLIIESYLNRIIDEHLKKIRDFDPDTGKGKAE